MDFNTNFELRRLLRLLTERLAPACKAQTLEPEELDALKREIHWEGDKVYVEVMKVMCRAYDDEHLRRYLEVHRQGAEHLKKRIEELLLKAGEDCMALLEAFEGVLDGVLNWLGNWQKRYFGVVQNAETEKWWTSERVMEELGISSRTLYSYTRKGVFDCRKFGRGTRYSRESVMRLK